MYPFERFSEDAKDVLVSAQREAEQSRHSYIGTEHMLLGLLRGDTAATRILVGLGVDATAASEAIEKILGRNERIVIQQIVPTSRVKKVIELSFEAAEREGSALVTAEHLVIGLLEEGEGIAAHVLGDMGVSLERFQEAR